MSLRYGGAVRHELSIPPKVPDKQNVTLSGSAYGELDAIRMRTNYDMDSTTPFAVLLIGQLSTLRNRMKHGILAALDQRISISYQSRP